MDKLYIIDRFEENYIILESPEGKMINVDKESVIGKVKEGDCLLHKDKYFLLDENATEIRRHKIAEKMKGMWKD